MQRRQAKYYQMRVVKGRCLHKGRKEGERINRRIEMGFFNKRKEGKMIRKYKMKRKRNNSMWSNDEGNLWKLREIEKDVRFLSNKEVNDKKKKSEMKN